MPLDIRRVHSTMLLAIRRTQNNLKVTKQITDTLEDTHFSHPDVIKNETPLIAHWLFNNYVNSELSELAKNDTPPIIFNQHLQSITSDLCDYTEMYTDGSKTDNGVGAAVNQLHNLTNSGYSIILIWIPSNSQITGNERADEKARQAITSPDAIKLNDFTLHDAKSLSKTITSNIWLRAWRLGSTKLNEIKHTTLAWPSPPNISRKIETEINRMRIGHSSLTHQHLMKREDLPICTNISLQNAANLREKNGKQEYHSF
ncbi:hypothetical protein QTP88_009562 [Uroleucon formosanum]